MVIMLMGPQGSGKGTIGELLSERLEIPLVGVGELLRDLPEDHSCYERIHDYMDRGALVPNELVGTLIEEKVSLLNSSRGYILDGWGRIITDMDFFYPDPDQVVELHISRETSSKRITGRRICTSDGRIYNVYTLPKEHLDECEGELIQRRDDTEEAVNKRLDIYYSKTQETLDYFKDKGILKIVDAEGPPDEVLQNVLSAIGLE